MHRPSLTLARSFVALACLLLAAGCGTSDGGGDAPSTACGVPTRLVTALIGSEDLEVTAGEQQLPVGSESTGSVRCRVSAADGRLTVSSSFEGTYAVAPALHRIAEYDSRFEVDGAPAGVASTGDGFQGTAVCGMVVTRVEGSAGGDEASAQKALLTALAEKAECARLPGTPRVATTTDVTAATETVCGVPGDLVRTVAGADDFYVMVSGPALPLTSPPTEIARCAAYRAGADDDVPPLFGVEAAPTASASRTPADVGASYSLGGGTAATSTSVDGVLGALTCRGTTVSIGATGSSGSSAVAPVRRLLAAYAGPLGCG